MLELIFDMISKMNLWQSIKKWILENRLETTIILLIILTALFLRLYRIDQYMTFLGDEGRDMLIMKKIWVEKDLPFIGPPTSVGNMYLGPLYYYMMAVATGIFWMNPVAAAVMVAFIGTFIVGFIYYLSRIWFGKIAAIVSSLLYAFSPVNIIYSKSSWNPNPAPLFALLSIFGIYKTHVTRDFRWFILSGIGLAFAIQMHYLALLLIPVVGLLWLYELFYSYKNKFNYRFFILGTGGAIASFLLLMSPLVFFDLKHNYPNYRAFMTLLTDRDSAVSGTTIGPLLRMWQVFNDLLVGRYFATEYSWLTIVVSILILASLVWVTVTMVRGKSLRWPYLGLGVWLIVSLFGLILYKNSIYDHYLGFLNPAPFLLFGSLGALLLDIKKKELRLSLLGVYGVVIFFIVWGMIVQSPLKTQANNQLRRTQIIAKEVLANTEDKPYNFALIAKSNYDAAYQFYLEEYGQKPGQLPFEKTDQLFVVCEDEECAPINHPKYEIAAFGMAQIEWEKDFQGVKLFKLIANPEGKP